MKRILLITLSLLFSACSSSDDSNEPNDNNSTFTIELSGNSTAFIDEVIEVTVLSNETMKSLEFSFDNFETSSTSFSDLEKTTTRYFSLDKLGANTIYFKAKNNEDEEVIETMTISTTRGNAIQITSVKVISFSNMDNTWDSEFSDSDANRLADVFFNLRKPKPDSKQGGLSFQNWFKSEIKENQGDLTWDVSSKNLYLNPEFALQFSMADDDSGVVQDIMLGPPFEREVTFQDYIATKPNIVTLKVDEIDLEIEFTVGWPN